MENGVSSCMFAEKVIFFLGELIYQANVLIIENLNLLFRMALSLTTCSRFDFRILSTMNSFDVFRALGYRNMLVMSSAQMTCQNLCTADTDSYLKVFIYSD